MLKFTYNGHEYEFRGEYRPVQPNEYFLSDAVGIEQVVHYRNWRESTAIRAIVHPVEKYHDFGGVRFRETGEVRKAVYGEWWLASENIILCQWEEGTNGAHQILEPVEIISKE